MNYRTNAKPHVPHVPHVEQISLNPKGFFNWLLVELGTIKYFLLNWCYGKQRPKYNVIKTLYIVAKQNNPPGSGG